MRGMEWRPIILFQPLRQQQPPARHIKQQQHQHQHQQHQQHQQGTMLQWLFMPVR
jgi:hypothetical protein